MSRHNLTVTSGKVTVNPDLSQYTALNGDYIQMFKHPKTLEMVTDTITVWDYMFSLTTSERWVITQLLNSYNHKNNVAQILADSEVQKNYIKHGYKKLYEDGWICRIKRGFYMVNPAIVKMPPSLVLDALLQWNTHCHSDAVVALRDNTLLTSYDIDIDAVLKLLDNLVLKGMPDHELLSKIKVLRDLNWIDSANQMTNRCFKHENVKNILTECKDRGLI